MDQTCKVTGESQLWDGTARLDVGARSLGNYSLLPISLFGVPKDSATTADPGTSFNMQTPEPGPHAEGDTAQRVHFKSCLLEDATIGNCNKMTVHSGSKGEVTGSGDSEEPKEDTGEPGHRCLCAAPPHTPPSAMA